MFNFRLPKRGHILLVGAGLLLSLIPLIGSLESANVPSASAASSSGGSSVGAASKDNVIDAANRRKKTPKPFVTPSVTPTVTATATAGPSSGLQPIGDVGGSWSLVFNDEFNGTSLDKTKWSDAWDNISGIYGPVNDAEYACYDSEHLLFSGGGTLHMRLESQPENCKGADRAYAGALIHSNGKFDFAYGYYEVRAYLPADSSGLIANWPAIWSDGQNWPVDGENDTLEGLSGNACYYFHYALNGGRAGKEGGCATGNYAGWHTFASDWEPGSITYYYDGHKVGQVTSGITSAKQYLILDYTQGQWGGTTSVPAEMQIDYVRVWQH